MDRKKNVKKQYRKKPQNTLQKKQKKQNITNIQSKKRKNYQERDRYERYNKNIDNRRKNNTKSIKKRHINKLSSIFAFVLVSIMVAYFIVSIVKGLNKKPIDYDTVKYGSISNNVKVNGAIIRDEAVYKATKTGIIEFNVPENEKVKKDSYIAKIKDKENIKTTEKDLEKINNEILKLQNKRKEFSLFSEDIKKIDEQIQNVLENNVSDFLSYDMSKIYDIRDNVLKKINMKNQMLLSENTDSVKNLATKKRSKEEELNKNISNIFAQDSGILSYYVDGFENIFTPKNKDKITKEQIKMKPKLEEQFRISVIKDEPIFKIVKDNTFYIASYIDTKNVINWEKGQEKTIYINENGTLSPLNVFVDTINIKDKDSYVVMKCNINMIDYIDKRSVVFDINMPKVGFKIDKKAIAKENLLKIPKKFIKNENIIKKTLNGEKKIFITPYVRDEDEDSVYLDIDVNMLDIGDTIINEKKEHKITEILETQGIYIVNSGVYVFHRINMQNATQNDQFVVLDPYKNKDIILYDRYAPDVSVVNDKEKINDI